MPDDNNDSLNAILQDAVGGVGMLGANAVTQAAYQAVLKNLQDRFNDYSRLGPAGYKNIDAQQLGSSAFGGIQDDPQARIQQQAAISKLGDIANNGGLELSDMAALNKIQGNLSRNNAARNNSLANQFAARGQLGSGAQLAMSMANGQNAAESANQHGEEVAGEAQKRAMQAIIQRGQAARSMSNDEWARKAKAAEAADAIAKYNANARTGAAHDNNTIAGQNFRDTLDKLHGETGLTNSMNDAVMGSGKQNATTIAGGANIANGLIGALSKIKTPGGGGGGDGSGGDGSNPPDSPDEPGTQNTQDFNANLQPDPTDGSTSGAGDFDTSFLDDVDTGALA